MSANAFGPMEDVADAVMYEGYVLYPYRASAMKNRCRWQFGVVAPRTSGDDAGSDPWYQQTECLVEGSIRTSVTVKVRCLHLQRRTVEEPVDGADAWRPCERVVVDGRELLTWDEGVPEAIVSPPLDLETLSVQVYTMPFRLLSAVDSEVICRADGSPAARIKRERRAVSALIHVSAETADNFMKLRVRVENATPIDFPTGDRGLAVRHCLLGCHTLLHVQDGRFVSLVDPPAEAADIAKSCVNRHAWPVLGGRSGSRELMLSAPIILYDYPAIAPESHDRFFDGTEIDEMLALRVMTMTDEEKRQAAATDACAAAIVERTGGMEDSSLHGSIRSFEELLNPPSSTPDFVEIRSVRVSQGSRVRLAPHKRADSMDMFLAGRAATVSAVHRDLENRVYLAVIVDGDPGADLREAYGRFFYFSPDEVRPLEVNANAGAE